MRGVLCRVGLRRVASPASLGSAQTCLLRCGLHPHSWWISLRAARPSLPSRGQASCCLIPFWAFFVMYARCHQLQNNNVQLWTLPTMCLNSTGPDARTQFVEPQPSLPIHLSSPLLASRRRLRAKRPDSLRDTRSGISSAFPNLPRAAIWFPLGCRACNDGTQQRAESCPARIICQFPRQPATAPPKLHEL